MDELTIQKLLDGDIDPALLREELLDIGRKTAWEPFLEIHHVEPERVEEVNLTVLQHLAIHICVALITPTRSNYAKVLAFVKPFPGVKWCRLVSLETAGLTERLVSFGQKGNTDVTKMVNHPNTRAAMRETGRRTGAANGRKSAHKTRGKPRQTPITWGDKISDAMSSRPRCSCLVCHQEMAAHEGNIAQHQSGPKCNPPDSYVMSCLHCGKGFKSNNHGTLTRHQASKLCQKST